MLGFLTKLWIYKKNCGFLKNLRLVTSLAKSETVLSEVESRLRIESHELRAEKQRLDLELADSSAACATALQQAIDAKNEVDVLR